MEYDMEPEERKLYFNARGKTIVTACPGSGKTTSIVNKLYTISKEVEMRVSILVCCVCLLRIKLLKKYVQHIGICTMKK